MSRRAPRASAAFMSLPSGFASPVVQSFKVRTPNRGLGVISTNYAAVLLGLAALVTGCGQPEPTTLEECRSRAGRAATTEIGARAMLLDCGKRFASQTPSESPLAPDVPEEECHRRGGYYGKSYVSGGAVCVEPAPCTEAEKAHNKRVKTAGEARTRANEAECRKRGDAWDQAAMRCSAGTPAQELTMVCKP
jgi:hypothetical protein